MSRIKRALALAGAAAVLLGGLSRAEQSLIAPEDIRQENANYKTRPVERADYVETASASVSVVYPLTYYAAYEGVTARFVRYTVSRGDRVKKGDVLAVLEASASTVQRATMELNLQRAREAYQEGCRTRTESLGQLRRDLTGAQGSEREILRLRIEQAELAYQQYCLQQEYAIDNQQRALDELIEMYESTMLLAPADGIVSEVVYLKENEPVYTGQRLITMYSEEKMLLVVKDDGKKFRYGMPVAVEVGTNKARETLPGQVVAADNMLPENRRSGYACIRLDEVPDSEPRNPKALCEPKVVRNVLLIPRGTSRLESGNYYVSRLHDGIVQKRFINGVSGSAAETWVIQGLEEGELIIVD